MTLLEGMHITPIFLLGMARSLWTCRWALVFLCAVLALPLQAREIVSNQVFAFDIVERNAAEGLNQFARQTGTVLLYPYSDVKDKTVNAVIGRYSMRAALEMLLRGSGLSSDLTDKGAIKITLDSSNKINYREEADMHNEKHYFGKSLITALISTFALSNSASAQEDTAPIARGLEEIIVTAQKRSQSLQDIPISISAMTGESLADSGVDTQRLLSQTVPNFQVNNIGLFSSIYLRGVGTGYANAGLEPSIATYFDDQYFSRGSAGMWSFSDVERVEVLKGPQGTLYGRNATGGAVRVISKAPTDYFEGRIAGSIGSFDHRGLEAMVSGPLAEGIRGRLVLQSDKNDGFVRNTDRSRPNLNDRDQVFARAKLEWDISDNLLMKLNGYYAKKKDYDGLAFMSIYETPYQTGLAVGGTPGKDFYSTSVALYPDREFEIRNYGVTLRFDYTLGNLTLSSITGYNDDKFSGPSDLDTTELELAAVFTRSATTEDFSQEFQVVSDYTGRFNFTSGLFLYQSEATYDYALRGDFISESPIGSYDAVEIQSIAPYGEIYYDVTDKWKLTLGARYTYEEKKLADHQFFMADSFEGARSNRTILFDQPSNTLYFKEFTPRAVLSFQPTDDVMLYASLSRGFKSGGYSTPHPSPTLVDEVDTETLDAFELGWKTSFAGRVTFNGAIFHYDYKDLQVQLMDDTGTNATSNAADAKINGIEADLMIYLTDQLQLGFGGGYLDAEYDSYAGVANAFCMDVPECASGPLGGLGLLSFPSDLSGRDMILAPDFSGYIRAAYQHPLPQGLGLISANILYSYSSSYDYTPDGFMSEPSKSLVSAGVKWHSADDRFELTLSGQNLTDKKYTLAKAPFFLGGWQVPAAPRTWKLQASYNF